MICFACFVPKIMAQKPLVFWNEDKAMGQQKIPTTTLQKFRVEWKQYYSWLAWTIIMWKFLWFCETQFKMAAEGDAERKEKHPPRSVSIKIAAS